MATFRRKPACRVCGNTRGVTRSRNAVCRRCLVDPAFGREVARRIELYAPRAALGLPLFGRKE